MVKRLSFVLVFAFATPLSLTEVHADRSTTFIRDARRMHARFRQFRLEGPKVQRMTYGVLLAVYIGDLESQKVKCKVAMYYTPGGQLPTLQKYAKIVEDQGLLQTFRDPGSGRRWFTAGPDLRAFLEPQLGNRLKTLLGRDVDFGSLDISLKLAVARYELADFERLAWLSSEAGQSSHLKQTYGLMFEMYRRKATPRGMRMTRAMAFEELPAKRWAPRMEAFEGAIRDGFIIVRNPGEVQSRLTPGPRLEPFVEYELLEDAKRAANVVRRCELALAP